MVSRKPHPAELRERSMNMVMKLRAVTGNSRGSIARVGRQLGLNTETLRNWVNKAEVDVDTACGFVYSAFVTDLFSRRIVGWQVADRLRARPERLRIAHPCPRRR